MEEALERGWRAMNATKGYVVAESFSEAGVGVQVLSAKVEHFNVK